ncbi:MAG: hypothetical protein M3Z85_18910 [Acidobacteriota bacterium]|nr:hypothetical protein [Acidobacteriota bacterium]
MKILLMLVLTVAVVSAADKKPKKEKVNKTGAAAAASIPADAIPTGDGSFRYTDSQGKKWLYRNTPFGVSKVEEKPAEPAAPAAVDERTKAVESGDIIRFERPGPFGPARWEKRKTDLDPSEQAVWDRERQKTSSPR